MIFAIVFGFAIGSIPFGLLLTRSAGLGDIRSIGSGNIGATNVLRTGRKDLAAATLVLDLLKGVAAVLLVRYWLGDGPAAVAGLAAVIGHTLTPWLKFRGGKGVATGCGALLGIAWPMGSVVAAVWILLVVTTRLSSLAALAACLIGPLAALYIHPYPWAVLCIAAWVIWRHRGNIVRLLNGTEPRIGAK